MLPGALALAACAATPAESGFWDTRFPDRNAERAVRLFADVCIANLGRTAAMHRAVRAADAGFKTDFAGNRQWGPVWSSPMARISASDHGHHHDGDECQLDVRRPAAPSAEAAIRVLRRRGLIDGIGVPSELGATAFRRGDRLIFVRYLGPDERSGVDEEAAGLMLLIKRPAG